MSSSSTTPRLFQPLRVGNMRLQNRVVMAPLTRFRADEQHVPSPLAATYYAQRGSSPGTLLVTEATFISPRAGGYPGAPGIYSDAQIAAWRDITAAVHAKGSFIYLQLWALGRVAPAETLAKEGGYAVKAPSAIPYEEGKTVPEPLTEEEIKDYVAEYAQAAKNAIAAGFDGVEIHGANGYLIDQFWQDVSNTRTDGYGGSIANRARFGLEVTRAVIAAVGDSKKVGMRLSPFGDFQGMCMSDPIAQFSHIVSELAPLDLAYLSLIESRSGGGAADAEYEDRTRENDALVQIWGPERPVIFAGGFDAEKARRVTEEYYPEHAALVAFGRYFISTPDIAERLRKGTELNAYDRTTFYGGGEKGYTDYPFEGEVKA